MKSLSAVNPTRSGRVFALLVGLLISAGAAQAQLVVFDFSGTSPGQNTPWSSTSTLASGITLTGWTLGSGLTANSTNNRFTATNWSQGAAFSDASSGSDYITFSLAPTAGNQINLSSATITFSLQNSGTGPDFYSVRSSVDSFGSDLSASSTSLNTAGGTTSTSLTLPSSVAYTGLTGTVEFRIYGWGAGGTTGTFSVNSWSMNGSVSAVPEPATYAVIVGGAVLAGAFLQRRRARTSAAQN